MTAIIQYLTTIASKLNEIDIVNGQLIFVSDTREIYLDFNGIRTAYRQIIPLATEEARVNYLAPIKAFYFVDETKVFWQVDSNGDWIQLTTPPKESIVFLNYKDFPQVGKENVLYISETDSFIWSEGEYVKLGTQKWELF